MFEKQGLMRANLDLLACKFQIYKQLFMLKQFEASSYRFLGL